jgi:hypothetical protein
MDKKNNKILKNIKIHWISMLSVENEVLAEYKTFHKDGKRSI